MIDKLESIMNDPKLLVGRGIRGKKCCSFFSGIINILEKLKRSGGGGGQVEGICDCMTKTQCNPG